MPEGILPGKNIIGRSPYMIPRKPGEYVYPGKVTIIHILVSLGLTYVCNRVG